MAKDLVGRLEDAIVSELVALGQLEKPTRQNVSAALRADIVQCVELAIRTASRAGAVVPPGKDKKDKK